MESLKRLQGFMLSLNPHSTSAQRSSRNKQCNNVLFVNENSCLRVGESNVETEISIEDC